MAVLFSLPGCAVKNDSHVRPGDNLAKHRQDFVIYDGDSDGGRGGRETRYVLKGSELFRITPERPEELTVAAEELAPVDAEFKAASSPALLENFINKYAPTPLAFVAVKRLAGPAIDSRNWSAAIEIFEKYRDKFPSDNQEIDSIISILQAPEEGLNIDNLGGGINTSEAEFSPVISSDGKTIYFARDCGECNGGEEVYVSHKDADGIWGHADRFGEPLSSKGHEIPLGISSDGTRLAVFGHYQGSLGRGDIFYVEKTPEGWGKLQHYPSPINSENFESNAMYTADGKAILFVSERPGGIGDFHAKGDFFNGGYVGNTDIYVYVPGAAEGQGQIVNLGPVINTPYGEYSPYLHPDGKTLYFSSNGHAGLGGLDVFKSTRLSDDSWTEWSEPVNLGKEVNTTQNDWGYQVAAQGGQTYFAKSSSVDGYGSSDIYSINLPEKAKPSEVISVSGIVTDPNGDPLVAEIRWDDLEAQKEVGYASSDPITGEYLIHLPYGGNYGYYADKPGYIGESQSFDLRKYPESRREYVLDIVLYPIEQPVAQPPVDQPVVTEPEQKSVEKPPVKTPPVEVRMNNVFFDFNKAELRSESYMEMNRWIKMLKKNSHIKLYITGHADSVGSDKYNQQLSERRAQAVVDYLVDNGIERDRLTAEGFGERNPVADNDTPEGRQQNRRVQVKIINSYQ